MMDFNEEQKRAIFGKQPLIVVSAGAGSGKTRVLTERYVLLCERKLQVQLGRIENPVIGAEVSEIVTLTFTEDAALEMRGRIRKRLMEKLQLAELEYPNHSQAACEYWKKQIEGLDNAIISTFHSFCQRIIQENLLEADVYPNFQVLDDIQSKLLKSEIFAELYEIAEKGQKWPSLLKYIKKGSLQESLSFVYGKIREYEMNGPLNEALQIDALVHSWDSKFDEFERDFYTFFQSNHDVSKLTKGTAQTFNDLKAIFQNGQKDERLINSLKTALESAVVKKVPVKILDQCPPLYDLLQKWLEVRNLQSYQQDKELIDAVLFEFESLFIAFDEVYEQRKREIAALDFSDLQQKAIRLMNNPKIQSHYSANFRHFLVDEMQDTNQLQLRMIEKMNPAYRFIVGDGKQSIYRFRGADVQIFNEIIREAKDNSSFSFIDMNKNYRTCKSIIDFINLLFEQEHMMGAASGEAVSTYKTEYLKMTADRDSAREVEVRAEYIKVGEEQDQNEYVMIARRMVQLIKEKKEIYDKEKDQWRPVEWRDMAVLIAARTNLTTLELALKAYEIPYNVYGGLGFYDRQEVIDYLSLLQWLNKPYEPLYMMAVLRSPLFGVTMEEFLEIQQANGDSLDLPSFIYERQFLQLNIAELNKKLEHFCRLFEKWAPFPWTVNNRQRLLNLFEDSGLRKALFLQKNNLMKLKNIEKLIETITNLNAATMDDMLNSISILAELSNKEGDAEVELTGGNFVHVMTVHGSKGLEFPVVLVPNLSKGMLSDRLPFRYDIDESLAVKFKVEDEADLLAEPTEVTSPNFKTISSISSDQATEESKRLFYVALTRARDLLILSSIDKGNNNTWYKWLEKALSESESLENFLQIKTEIPEQQSIQDKSEIYAGPKVKLERTIPISFSVSEVMSYLDGPEAFLEKHLLKLERAWLEEPELSDEFIIDEKINKDVEHQVVDPGKLGTIVHRICELLDKGYPEKDAYWESFSNNIPQAENDTYLKKVKPLVKAYLSKDFGQPIDNEWEFVLDVNGTQIIGEIDKVILKENHYEVLDLKTNRIHDNIDELMNYYKPQLYLYKMAYEKQKQVAIDKMSLVFLRDKWQGVYEISYEPSFEKQLLTAIKEMTKLKREVLVSG